MSKTGPIILIDDDHDDKYIFEYVIKEIGVSNKLIYFERCAPALEYLETTTDQPFIIFCDVNIPVCSGIEFKQLVDQNPKLRKKSIPFIFYSTSADQKVVNKAYMEMTVQRFFLKETYMEDIKKRIKMILEYWLNCYHPNSK